MCMQIIGAMPHKLFKIQLSKTKKFRPLEKSSTFPLNSLSSTEICQQNSSSLYRLLTKIFSTHKNFSEIFLNVHFLQTVTWYENICKNNIINNWVWKYFTTKVYIKSLNFVDKSQWRKGCWGGMYYFFPGAQISLFLWFKIWKAYGQ